MLLVTLISIGAVAAALILMMFFLFRTPIFNPTDADPLHVELDDPNIPLVQPDVDDTG